MRNIISVEPAVRVAEVRSLAIGVVPFQLHSGTPVLGIPCPWHVGTQAQSCLLRLSAGSCLFPLPICLAPLGAVGADLWQPLVLECPRSREIPREGAGFIQQTGRPFLNLGAGLWEVFIPGLILG